MISNETKMEDAMRRIIQIALAATGTLARFKAEDEFVGETIDV